VFNGLRKVAQNCNRFLIAHTVPDRLQPGKFQKKSEGAAIRFPLLSTKGNSGVRGREFHSLERLKSFIGILDTGVLKFGGKRSKRAMLHARVLKRNPCNKEKSMSQHESQISSH
jgi:hypothetical protein